MQPRSTLRQLVFARWPEGCLVFMTATALFAPLTSWDERGWIHLLWLAALAALLVKTIRHHFPGKAADSRGSALEALVAVLLINMMVSATGGINSTGWLAYLTLLLVLAFRFEEWWRQLLYLSLIAGLEFSQTLHRASPEILPGQLWRLAAGLAFLVVFLVAVGILYRREKKRLQHSLAENRRLRIEAEEFRRREEYDPEPAQELLSPEARESRLMSTAMDMDSDLDRVLSLARMALGAQTVLYFKLSEEADALEIRRASESGPPVDPEARFHLGEGVIGGAAKMGRSVLLTEIEGRSGIVNYYKESGRVQSLLVVPVSEQDVVLGVLVADSPRTEAFSQVEQDILEGFSREVTLILEKVRDGVRRERRSHRTDTLRFISTALSAFIKPQDILEKFVELTYEAVPYDQCAVYLADPERERFKLRAQRGFDLGKKEVSIPMDEGLVRYAMKHDQPLLFSNLEGRSKRLEIVPGYSGKKRPRSLLSVPILYQDGLLGHVFLTSMETDAFDTYHLDYLKVLANQVGVLISNAMLHEKMEKMAVTDGLTGLFNHRHFQEKLAHELERSDRHGEPLSLLFLDLDYFKKINDNYGHPFGDQVLRTVGAQLKHLARRIDFVSRYGGEEFAIIMVNTERHGCRTMARRIVKVIRETKFSFEGKMVPVTVSIGTATFPQDCGNREELIRRADQALYSAKESGRDQHVSFQDLESRT